MVNGYVMLGDILSVLDDRQYIGLTGIKGGVTYSGCPDGFMKEFSKSMNAVVVKVASSKSEDRRIDIFLVDPPKPDRYIE